MDPRTPRIRFRECSKLVLDSFTHTLDKAEKLLPVYELLNRIRLRVESNAVLAEAEEILKRITEQYYSPNLSVEEIRMLVQSHGPDPLKSFGEACRVELKSIRGTV